MDHEKVVLGLLDNFKQEMNKIYLYIADYDETRILELICF